MYIVSIFKENKLRKIKDVKSQMSINISKRELLKKNYTMSYNLPPYTKFLVTPL